MKMIVEVNVFVMPRHFDRFGGLTGLVVEYVSCKTVSIKVKTTAKNTNKQKGL
jgi:hypothetical protein